MKTVNVFVCIQMDIPNQDVDQVSEVQRVLDKMNEDGDGDCFDIEIERLTLA
jgi:hypothetical protein